MTSSACRKLQLCHETAIMNIARAAVRKGRRMMTRLLKQQRSTMPEAVQALARQLADAGYKMTIPRLSVLDAAVDHAGSFTAADIDRWLAIRERSPGAASIGRSAVHGEG